MRQSVLIILALTCVCYSFGLMGCSENEEPIIIEEVVDKQLRKELVTGSR